MDIIGRAFSQVPETLTSSAQNVHALLQQFESNRNIFISGLTECFLQIIKNILQAPQGLIDRYEQFIAQLFETLYSHFVKGEQDHPELDQENQNLRRRAPSKRNSLKNEVFTVFQYFLQFFSDGMESQLGQIQVHCGRLVFTLLKILTPDDLVNRIDYRVSGQVINATLTLFRDKRSNLKTLAIQIASFLQILRQTDNLSKQIGELRTELIRAMCQDEKEVVRQMALDNLELNDESFPNLIKRLRDQNCDIRCTVFRKLIKEKVPISNLALPDIYKLVYDGLGSRDQDVYINARRYLQKNFNLFKEEDEIDQEKLLQKGEMDIIEESSMIRREKKRVSVTPHQQGFFRDMRVKLLNFLKTFEIQRTLLYPAIYQKLELMVREMVKSIVDPEEFSLYLRHLLSNSILVQKQRPYADIQPEELFVLRVICQMMYPPQTTIENEQQVLGNTDDHSKEVPKQISDAIDDCFPNGVEYAKILLAIHDPPSASGRQPNLLAVHQALLIAEMTINSDEAGKQQISEALRFLVLNLKNIDAPIPQNEQQSQDYWNDIYFCQKVGDMKNLMFSQSYNETPIIPGSNELLTIIMRIYKKLCGENIRHFTVKVLELISELREPVQKREDMEEEDINTVNYNVLTDDINKYVFIQNQKKKEVEEALENIRRNQPRKTAAPTQQEYNLEKEKEQVERSIKEKENELEVIKEKIFFVELRSLILAQTLLQTTPVDPQDPAIKEILLNVIWPSYRVDTTDLKAYGYQALALFVMLDQTYVEEYFSVFVCVLQDHVAQLERGESQVIQSDEMDPECNPLLVTSLRALVDMILMYGENTNAQQKKVIEKDDEGDEGKSIDIPLVADLLMKFALKGKIFVRMLAIQGLCQIIFNERVPDPVYSLTVLLTIWFDYKIVEDGGARTIQVISTFFRSYTRLSKRILDTFGKAFRTYIHLLIEMTVRKLEFNDQCISYDPSNEDTWQTVCKVGLNLLSYAFHKDDEWVDVMDNGFGAQQDFLFYLCQRAIKGAGAKFYSKILENLIAYFDFIDHKMPEQLFVIKQFLEQVGEQADSQVEIDKVLSLIRLKLGAENEPEDFEDQIMRVIDKIKQCETESSIIMKNFKELGIISEQKGDESIAQMSTSRINSTLVGDDLKKSKQMQQLQQQDDNEDGDSGNEEERLPLQTQQDSQNILTDNKLTDNDSQSDENQGIEKQKRGRKQNTTANTQTQQPQISKKRRELDPIKQESPGKSFSEAPAQNVNKNQRNKPKK